MKQYRLNEDRLPQKLHVVFSSKIRNRIDDIYTKNQNNVKALYQWFDYIDGIESYISNPTISWDNMGRYPNYNNERRFINDFDYNVGCIIKINSRTNLPYVYVFKVNLKPKEFGLIESKNRINRIISEVINQYLRQNLIIN